MAKAYGSSKQAILDGAAAIGLIVKGAGQSASESAALGNRMVKLAADAESFYNVPLSLALEKIRAGLIGEYEPMRAFGGQLSEETVAAEAVALGLAKTTKEVDIHAKTAARASLIVKSLSDAEGDLARTADSAKNQARTLSGTIDNLAVAMGTALMPITKEVIAALNDLTQSLINVGEKGGDATTGWINRVAEGFGVIRRNIGDFAKFSYNAMADPFATFGFKGAGQQKLMEEVVARELALRAKVTDQEVAAAAAAAKKAAAQKEAAKIAADEAEAKKKGIEADKEAKNMAEWIGNQQKIHMDHEAERRRAAKEAAKEAEKEASKKDTFTSTIMGTGDMFYRMRGQILSTADETAKKQLEVSTKMEAHTKIIAEEIVKNKPMIAGLA